MVLTSLVWVVAVRGDSKRSATANHQVGQRRWVWCSRFPEHSRSIFPLTRSSWFIRLWSSCSIPLSLASNCSRLIRFTFIPIVRGQIVLQLVFRPLPWLEPRVHLYRDVFEVPGIGVWVGLRLRGGM